MWCHIHLLELTARACFLFVGLTQKHLVVSPAKYCSSSIMQILHSPATDSLQPQLLLVYQSCVLWSPSYSIFLTWHRSAYTSSSVPHTSPPPSSPCSPSCPIPGCCLTGGKPGLTGGQAVSRAHRREHRLSPLISSSLPPYLNPAAPNPSPLHPPSCWGNIKPDTEVFLFFFFFLQPSCLKGGFSPCCLPLFLMYVFVLKVNIKLWKNRLWKEISHGVRIKGAFTCTRAAWKCFPPSESCWEAFIKNILFYKLWQTERHFSHPDAEGGALFKSSFTRFEFFYTDQKRKSVRSLFRWAEKIQIIPSASHLQQSYYEWGKDSSGSMGSIFSQHERVFICRSRGPSKRKLLVLSKHAGSSDDPLRCISALIIQFCRFIVIRSSASLLFFRPGTSHFPSAAAVIGFHVNWDGSGDRQITSACFTSCSQTHKYRCIQMHTHTCKQRDSLSPHARTHTHTHTQAHTPTHTFTRVRLDCCHGVFLMSAEMTVEMQTL